MSVGSVGSKVGGVIALIGVFLLIYGIVLVSNFEGDAVWKGTSGSADLAKGKYQVWYWGDEYTRTPAITIRDQNNIAVFSCNSGAHSSESMTVLNNAYSKAGTFEAVIDGNYTIAQSTGGTTLYIKPDVVNTGVYYLGAAFGCIFIGIVIAAISARVRERSGPPAPVNRHGGAPLPHQHGYDMGSGSDAGAPAFPPQTSGPGRRPDRRGSRPSGPEPGQMAEPRPLEDESQLSKR